MAGCQASCVAGLFCLADLLVCCLLTGNMASLVSFSFAVHWNQTDGI